MGRCVQFFMITWIIAGIMKEIKYKFADCYFWNNLLYIECILHR